MELLKQRIIRDGIAIGKDTIKVDGFLNHQIDVALLEEIGKEFAERFKGCEINKILTVESSGIAVAVTSAKYFGYPPVVFAKKTAPNTMVEGCYEEEARSFTKGTVSVIRVSEKYIHPGDKVLILDDFLAHGEASLAMTKLIRKAGAEVAGIGIVIEKGFQIGSSKLRSKGFKVESLAIIEKIEDGKIIFADDENADADRDSE